MVIARVCSSENVDDLNIIGHTKDIDEERDHLKTEFEMKDLVETNFA
jgi:hypothetical protein